MTNQTTTSFQLPPALLSQAQARARELGLSMAAYLRLLILADIGKTDSITSPAPAGESRKDELAI